MTDWSIPKTDWHGETVNGVYTGDYFNAVDFNRIKNNLIYLREMAIKMYDEFAIQDVGNDKTYADYFYADEINALNNNLVVINKHSVKMSLKPYGASRYYFDNLSTMDFNALNRLERATLELYDKLTNQSKGRRKLKFNFGTKGVF